MRRAQNTAADDKIQGFTLVELLVGLLIVAMASGLAGFALSGRQAEEGKAAFATKVVQLLSVAHQDALVTGTTRTVKLDLQSRNIAYLHRDKTENIPDSVEISVLVGLELIATDGLIPILFFGEGGSTGAEITIADSDGPAITVQTNWLTGLTYEIRDEDR
ncbi:prepilin-type N-terminal cleavage/methylation domain-containing protein [Hoeflea sp. TYP-13]|uniref:prepilin-type N-terminal cleavage/methylation domain-containing protein n=1 Tax=Hoeflea sp. TYP-13 TaxID=3230023 RepID=UPI0034C6D4E0